MNTIEGKMIYIGEFPPPFGGVSVKNALIKEHIFAGLAVEWVNMYDYKKNPLKLVNLLVLLYQAKKEKWNIYIGSGSQKRLEWILCLIQLICGDEMLGRTSLFIMASTLYNYCKEHIYCLKLLQKTKILYVELQSMVPELNTIGLNNVDVLPNCRDGSKAVPPHKLYQESAIKLLFFSTISREKGVPYLFEMTELLKGQGINFKLDFYGELSENYKEEFMQKMEIHPECMYGGIFDTVKNNLYKKMNQYDILLLPTQWKGEGCPGVLVESKMAGIPAIVSNHKYNSEVVLDGKEGFVVDDDFGVGFADAVGRIYNDEQLYGMLAEGAYESRKSYDFATYAVKIRGQNK